MTSLLADLRAQPDFRTELWSQPEAEPKSEVTHSLTGTQMMPQGEMT